MGPSQGRYPQCLGTPHRVFDHLRCDVVNTVLYARVLPLHLPLRVTSDHTWCVPGSTYVRSPGGRIHRSTLVVTMVDQLVTLFTVSRTSHFMCWAWVVHYV